MSDALAEVGGYVRSLREARGWSQSELAAMLGRSQTAVSYWESGRRALGVDDLIDVANVFGISPSEMLPRQRRRSAPALLRAIAEEVDSSSLARELERFTAHAESLPVLPVRHLVGAASPRDTAEQLLNVAGINGPPIDIESLVNDCGVHIVSGDLAEIDALVLELEKGAAIYINDGQLQTRQRFSLAHELGHHLLRHVENFQLDLGGNLGPNAIGEHPSYDWRVEREANDFAANLLMPAQWVRERYDKRTPVQQLAQIFGVSRAAMRFRIKHLGL